MKLWFTSLNGAITLSVIAFLTFLGRAFVDWRFEYLKQDPTGNWASPGALIYMALAGGWVWGLMAATRGSRGGLIASLIFALLLDIAMALTTYFIWCAPWSSCQAWPNAWTWNWANLISGLLAVAALTLQLRQRQVAG